VSREGSGIWGIPSLRETDRLDFLLCGACPRSAIRATSVEVVDTEDGSGMSGWHESLLDEDELSQEHTVTRLGASR
jgi:hypothetical protein